MSEQEHLFLKNLRQLIMRAGVSVLVAIIIGAGSFFIVTKIQLTDHSKRLNNVEENSVTQLEYQGHINLQDVIDENILSTLDEIKDDVKDIQSKL